MAAVDITFANGYSHAFVLVGKAWFVTESNIPTLRNWIMLNCGLCQTANKEILVPEHPNGEVLAFWLNKHAMTFTATGGLVFPDGRPVPSAESDNSNVKIPTVVVSPGLEALLDMLSKYDRRKGNR